MPLNLDFNICFCHAASLLYKDFRPTGKAVLTTSLPDYTPGVLSGASDIILPGAKIEAEAIYDIASLNIPENPADVGKEGAVDPSQLGTGPAARVPERKTVTITGIPGKRSFKDLDYLLEGFRLASDRKYAVSYIPKYVFTCGRLLSNIVLTIPLSDLRESSHFSPSLRST